MLTYSVQNGQDILDNLSALKPTLLHNYEQWEKQQQDEPNNDRTPDANHRYIPNEVQDAQDFSPRRSDSRYDDNRVRGRERERARANSTREYERVMQEELQRWKEQREDVDRHREEEEQRTASRASSRQRDAVVTVAKHAAGRPEGTGSDYTFSHPPSQASYAPQGPPPAPEPPRLQDRHIGHQQQQQEEFRRREEEIVRKREQKRREEQNGIAQRQQEAEQEARAVRQTIAANNPVPATPSSVASTSSMTYSTSTPASSLASTPSSSLYQTTTPTQAPYADLRAPRAVKSRPPSFLGPDDLPVPPVTPLPLESPTRYEGDSTDSESMNNHANEWRRRQKHAIDYSKTPTRTPARRCVFLLLGHVLLFTDLHIFDLYFIPFATCCGLSKALIHLQ
jgi:STAM-binding protein